MSEAVESVRFITSKQLVRDLCIREEDYVQSKRLRYMSFVKDAFIKLDLKTVMQTKRVALPVSKDLNYIPTPADYLELESIAAPDHNGKLKTMVVNTKVQVDVADLTLAKRCGCDCGCEHDYCSMVRNYEGIAGTLAMELPDGTLKTFNTFFRKIVMKNGDLVEEKTIPVKNYQNNIHISTTLQTVVEVLCRLEIKECGCVKHNDHNRSSIEKWCHAVDVKTECGCGHREVPEGNLECNIEEDGSRIYLPSDFRPDFIVLRYFANSKTKNILIPYLAKEPMMAAIKVIDTTFGKKEKAQSGFWKNELKQSTDTFMENLYPIKLTALYQATLGRSKRA
jgi:hypothetical protein